MKLKRKKRTQKERKEINCAKIRKPEGSMTNDKDACRKTVKVKVARNEKKLALGVTTVLLCFHNL